MNARNLITVGIPVIAAIVLGYLTGSSVVRPPETAAPDGAIMNGVVDVNGKPTECSLRIGPLGTLLLQMPEEQYILFIQGGMVGICEAPFGNKVSPNAQSIQPPYIFEGVEPYGDYRSGLTSTSDGWSFVTPKGARVHVKSH